MTSILKQPYSSRRILIAQDDRTYKQTQNQIAIGLKVRDAVDDPGEAFRDFFPAEFEGHKLVGGLAAGVAAALAPLAASTATVLSPFAAILSPFAAKKGIDIYKIHRLGEQGAIFARLSEVEGLLRFPPAHPQRNIAYAAHPLVDDQYFPLATFHRFMFEQKANELQTLLAGLGARTIKLVHHEGYEAGGGGHANVSTPGDVGGGSFSAKAARARGKKIKIDESYGSVAKSEPHVPEGLTWFESEATWQGTARRRLEMGAKSAKVELHYNDSFGISAEAALAVKGVNAGIGGEFQKFENTVWQFEVEFR